LLFDPDIALYLRDLLPWAGELFSFISHLGSELIFISLIMIGYWGFNKKESIIAGLILLFAAVSNYWLKGAIANPRPDSSYWYPGTETPNYSTPSGHSQFSASFYGWISIKVKTWWMMLASSILIILVGISRVYLGVHYLGDVLLGWGLGIVTVIVFYKYYDSIVAFVSRYNSDYLYIGVAFIGLIMIALAAFVIPLPPNDNFGSYGGLMIGLSIGLMLEGKYVNFSVEPVDGKKWKIVLRVIIGMILVIGLLLGLSSILPTAEIWLRALRYTSVVLVGIFVWPLIFTKAKL